MGFADAVATNLFLVRRRSDIEFKVQSIMQRKLAVLDRCNELSEILANTVFQSDQMGLISPGSPLPGITPVSPLVPLPAAQDVPTGTYELELAELQGIEKELDVRQKKLETELEAVKAEQESIKKIADDHAKKDFKVGS